MSDNMQEEEKIIWINAYPSSIYKREFEYRTASDLLVFYHAI